jgi:hypothetical protein
MNVLCQMRLTGSWQQRTGAFGFQIEFCYGVYNKCEPFICLDLMIKSRDAPIERYFK